MTDADTTGATSAAAATTIASIITAMPTTPTPIMSGFYVLLTEIEAIPGDVTTELATAKHKILAAMEWVESHFRIADAAVETDVAAIKTTAETDVASIKTDAAQVQAAVEKAV